MAAGAANLGESQTDDRGLGTLSAMVRPPRRATASAELERQGRNWKQEWYARGERVDR